MKKLTAILTALTMISAMTVSVNADTAFSAGDVDMDGVVTGHDAAVVSRFLREDKYSLTGEQLALADMDGDGRVTQKDADMIYNAQKYRLGNVDWTSEKEYLELADASRVIKMFIAYCTGKDDSAVSELSEVQKNLADMDLDGDADMVDALLIMDLFARLCNNMADENVSNGIYYYSAYENSPAYVGHNVFNKGDVDMDGVVTGHDAAMVSRYLLEEDYSLTEEQLLLADLNGDDEVTQYDAYLIITRDNTPEIGKIAWNDGKSYRNISDVRALLDSYVCRGAGIKCDTVSDAQFHNGDMNADGVTDLSDMRIIFDLYAMRAAGLSISNEENNIYYYSLDKSSPAYIG